MSQKSVGFIQRKIRNKICRIQYHQWPPTKTTAARCSISQHSNQPNQPNYKKLNSAQFCNDIRRVPWLKHQINQISKLRHLYTSRHVIMVSPHIHFMQIIFATSWAPHKPHHRIRWILLKGNEQSSLCRYMFLSRFVLIPISGSTSHPLLDEKSKTQRWS